MSNYNATLRAAIAAAIKTPADPKVTGAVLQAKLLSVIDGIDAGAVFLGAATPQTNPSSEANGFYLATAAGTYANFLDPKGNAITLDQGEVALLSSTYVQDSLRWAKDVIPTTADEVITEGEINALFPQASND